MNDEILDVRNQRIDAFVRFVSSAGNWGFNIRQSFCRFLGITAVKGQNSHKGKTTH